jgi:hypothetical protein
LAPAAQQLDDHVAVVRVRARYRRACWYRRPLTHTRCPEAVRREVERVVPYGTVSEARTLIEHLTGLPRWDHSVVGADQRRIAPRTACTRVVECAADQDATERPRHPDRPQADRVVPNDDLMRLMDC